MKNLFLTIIFSIVSVISLQAQFKISDKIVSNGFKSDTATNVTMRVAQLDIMLDSKLQRPVLYLSFNNDSGQSLATQNVGYDDVIRYCKKNNIAESQHETIVSQTFLGLLAGNKAQKLAVVRAFLGAFGITLKPDAEQ